MLTLFEGTWLGDAIGLPLMALGFRMSAWSVLDAGDTEVEAPAKLLTGRPYSLMGKAAP